ncbi:uncharacterized protein LOC143177256 [Calliopsis andreniformis]|uniref:uncharacterized protein LOC143177256 n=1 Tax=Calliopsis andreniformis TaxID=337506 RepID=UPI003FCD305F
MSDLATNLLTQYYGLGEESSNKKLVLIHQIVQNSKLDNGKQVTEEASVTTNEENVSEEESWKDDDSRKLSIENELYPKSSRVLDDAEDIYNPSENVDTFSIDLGPNIMCDIDENTKSSAVNEELISIFPSNSIIITPETLEMNGNDPKNANGSDLSLTPAEDSSLDITSDSSSVTLKKSQKSSKINAPLSLIPKRQPVCNEIFADFSNTELKHFPNDILNQFPQLKMLYLSDNSLTKLPAEIFSCLKHLKWFDVRNNQLSSLPASIESHPCIETLLLQGNKIEKLPLELCTLPKLKTLQVSPNPLIEPPQNIITSGYFAILEFLRTEWNNAHPARPVEFKPNKIEPKLSTILCYQSPRKNKKKKAVLKNTIYDTNAFEKRKSYKPSNRCENRGANVLMEQRLLWFSKARELFSKQASILQKMKDENVLREWRRDKRSFKKAMEKAFRRNEEDIPFGFNLEDYASIFKQKPKLEKSRPKKKSKPKFIPPADINKKISELLESLNQLQMKPSDEASPQTKQSLLQNQVEKILQFQSEIQNLQKYNDTARILHKLN